MTNQRENENFWQICELLLSLNNNIRGTRNRKTAGP